MKKINLKNSFSNMKYYRNTAISRNKIIHVFFASLLKMEFKTLGFHSNARKYDDRF